MGWKEKQREKGFKDLLVWLDPSAVEALERLKAASPGASVAELVSRAVIQSVRTREWGAASSVVDVRIAELQGRLSRVERILAE